MDASLLIRRPPNWYQGSQKESLILGVEGTCLCFDWVDYVGGKGSDDEQVVCLVYGSLLWCALGKNNEWLLGCKLMAIFTLCNCVLCQNHELKDRDCFKRWSPFLRSWICHPRSLLLFLHKMAPHDSLRVLIHPERCWYDVLDIYKFVLGHNM